MDQVCNDEVRERLGTGISFECGAKEAEQVVGKAE